LALLILCEMKFSFVNSSKCNFGSWKYYLRPKNIGGKRIP